MSTKGVTRKKSDPAKKAEKGDTLNLDQKIRTKIIPKLLKEIEGFEEGGLPEQGWVFNHVLTNQDGNASRKLKILATYPREQLSLSDITTTSTANIITRPKIKFDTILFYVFDPLDPSCLLGEGGQGKVYLARNVLTNDLVVIKQHLQKGMTFEEDRDREQRNLSIIGDLISTAQVSIDDSNANQKTDLTIMKYYQGINLIDHLYERDTAGNFVAKKKLTIWDKASLVRQVLERVKLFHDQRLVHRDIKTENFIKTRIDLSLVDLGSALIVDKEKDNFKPGSYGYIAPEMQQKLRKDCPYYDAVCDLWSVGVVIAEILTEHNFQAKLKEEWTRTAQRGFLNDAVILKNHLEEMMPDVFGAQSPTLTSAQEIEMWKHLTALATLLLQDRETRQNLSPLQTYSDNILVIHGKLSGYNPLQKPTGELRNLRMSLMRTKSTTVNIVVEKTEQTKPSDEMKDNALPKKDKVKQKPRHKDSTSKKSEKSAKTKEVHEDKSAHRKKSKNVNHKVKSDGVTNKGSAAVAAQTTNVQGLLPVKPPCFAEQVETILEENKMDIAPENVPTFEVINNAQVTAFAQDAQLKTADDLLAQLTEKLTITPAPGILEAEKVNSPTMLYRKSILIQLATNARNSGDFSSMKENVKFLADVAQSTGIDDDVDNEIQRVHSSINGGNSAVL